MGTIAHLEVVGVQWCNYHHTPHTSQKTRDNAFNKLHPMTFYKGGKANVSTCYCSPHGSTCLWTVTPCALPLTRRRDCTPYNGMKEAGTWNSRTARPISPCPQRSMRLKSRPLPLPGRLKNNGGAGCGRRRGRAPGGIQQLRSACCAIAPGTRRAFGGHGLSAYAGLSFDGRRPGTSSRLSRSPAGSARTGGLSLGRGSRGNAVARVAVPCVRNFAGCTRDASYGTTTLRRSSPPSGALFSRKYIFG